MDVVLDAQLVAWYYQALELKRETPCSAPPAEVFGRLGVEDIGVLDTGKKIEGEWRRMADPDWFESWLAERFKLGDIIEIEIETCRDLVRKLERSCGFPTGGGDKWYVRTAKTRADNTGEVVALISEDLDFFDPKTKAKPRRRQSVLRAGRGCVAKLLKRHDVEPKIASTHLV